MPEPTAGVVPLHHQIADSIRDQISTGELRPGDAIPSVGQLCERWNCAPGSAKMALAVLKNEGLLTGGRGRPATVRKQATRIRLNLDNTQAAKSLVLKPESERRVKGSIEMTAGLTLDDVISTHRYNIISANDQLAEEFSIEPGSELLQRNYEMTERDTDRRVAWSISYIPKKLIEENADLLDENKEPWPGGHMHQLYTVGIEIDRFVRSVIAIEPSTGDRQKWGMESGVPLLYIRSRSVDIHDRVVELSDAAYPADRTEITFVEQLRRWPKGHRTYTRDAERSDDSSSH
jgi:GntR family transcriptional regulator